MSMVTLETINRKIDRIIALLDRPLTPIQREILEYIRSRGSATQRDLQDDLGLSQSTVSYATRVLTRKQMIRERWNGKIKSYEVLPVQTETSAEEDDRGYREIPRGRKKDHSARAHG